jgi:predicted alpha/beta superfamily hydrolase
MRTEHQLRTIFPQLQRIFLILFALAPVCGSLFAQMPAGIVAPPTSGADRIDLVEIANTRTMGLHSSIVGQEYTLNINLPANYGKSTDSYSVLYLLDGQWDFPLVSAIYGEQYFDGFIPGVITVGITWGGDNPDYDKLRARDFTPSSPDGSARWGNAAKFLAFIKGELIPFIDSKYRTIKKERTLMGSSLGGLFALYTMFNDTELFNRYVLTSPAFLWDNGTLFSYEKEYAEKRSAIPVRLFMGIGGLEPGVTVFESQLVNHFRAAKYKGLQLETLIMDNTGHSGTKAEGYTRGLQSVYGRPSLKLPPALLDRYVGVYTTGTDTLKINREKDHLTCIMGNGANLALNAESTDAFYVKGIFIHVNFKKDDTDKVEGVECKTFGGKRYLKKIAK